MGYFLVQASLLDQYKSGKDIKKIEIDSKSLKFDEKGNLIYTDKNWPTFIGLYAPTYNAYLNNGAYVFVEEINKEQKPALIEDVINNIGYVEVSEEEIEEEGDLTGDNQKPRRGRPSQKA